MKNETLLPLDLTDVEQVETLYRHVEKERERLSKWVHLPALDGAVENTLVLRMEHMTKASKALGALYGELLSPTEGYHA